MPDIFISADGDATVDLQKYTETYEQRIKNLESERDALRKDATRYRLLREKSTDGSGDIEIRIWLGGEDGDWEWPTKPDEVDAAIDAAMQENPNA